MKGGDGGTEVKEREGGVNKEADCGVLPLQASGE